MRNARIAVRPITPTIGAVIEGVDLSAPLDDATFDEIHTAFLTHQVVFFPGQAITPQQQVMFAERFGEIDEPHPVFERHAEEPRVMLIEQRGKQGIYNERWHTDVTYQESPPMASVLHAQVLPESGGDTLWASMYAAYEALSEPMKATLEGLTAVHDFAHAYRDELMALPNGLKRLREIEDKYPSVEHPVVRTHPRTGRKLLFVNSTFTMRINGLTRGESDALLAYLFRHCESPMFQVRYRWRQHDVAIWDNRCTQHLAVPDFFPHHRRMNRVTVRGERPFYAA
jgi:taurine dioxygenase